MAESPKECFFRMQLEKWRNALHKAVAEARQKWSGSPDDHIGLLAATGKVIDPPTMMSRRHFCEEHGVNRKYSSRYDSYYCPSCNRWREPVCENPGCEFCKDRPTTPENRT